MNNSFDPNRVCSSRSRSPGRYTKEDLLTLGERLGFRFKKSDSIDKICQELRRHHRQQNENGSIRRNAIERCHVSLSPHQLRAIEYMNHHPSLFLFHRMGAGKTITAIVCSQSFLDQHPNKNVVILCPSSLITNFKEEMNKNYRNIRHRNRYKFYSIENANISVPTMRSFLRGGMLIVDEVHRLINNSQMTKLLLHRTNQEYDKVILMSGTPLQTHSDYYSEIYPILMHIDPPTMDNIMCKISFYERSKMDRNYPRRKNHFVRIPMNKSYLTKYNICLRKLHFPHIPHVANLEQSEFMSRLPILFNRSENRLKKLQSFLTGIRRATQILDNSVANAKLTWVLKFIEKHRREKTVIFSTYLKDGIDLIKNKIDENLSYGEISGRISLKNRKEILDRYNNGQLQVLFLSFSAKEGLSLKNTQNVIIFEPQWNPNNVEQMVGRAIRYKSHESLPVKERKVNVYYLYHLRPDEIPSVSSSSLARIMTNIPEDVSSHLIHPFLGKENQDIKSLNKYLKTLRDDKNEFLQNFDNISQQEKKQYQKKLRRASMQIDLQHISIDYYLYFANFLKKVKMEYYEYLLKKKSIEQNPC